MDHLFKNLSYMYSKVHSIILHKYVLKVVKHTALGYQFLKFILVLVASCRWGNVTILKSWTLWGGSYLSTGIQIQLWIKDYMRINWKCWDDPVHISADIDSKIMTICCTLICAELNLFSWFLHWLTTVRRSIMLLQHLVLHVSLRTGTITCFRTNYWIKI